MKKRLIGLILAALVMASIISGCNSITKANGEDKTSIKTEETQKDTKDETKEETYPETVIIKDVEGELQFDFDEAMKNIYIAGKKISMPTTLAELGEGFSFSSEGLYPYIDGEITCEGLLYKGEEVAIIRFEKGIGKKYNRNSKIVGLLFSTMGSSELNNKQGIYKFRVGFPMTEEESFDFAISTSKEQRAMFKERKIKREEILNYFGRPTEVKSIRNIYKKNNSKDTFIEFTLNEEHGLYDIMIRVNG